tara:strand:+ start:1170 stop:1604 length:435 start_codon:yes stop_codon:yes gene_type:complete
MENIKKIIKSHIPPGVELLSVKHNPHSSFIKVVIDSKEEISVDQTALLAKDLKNNEYFISNYPDGLRLEVGTPGVGSELEKIFQYEKNIGRNIELKYVKNNELIKKIYLLHSVSEEGITIKNNDKEMTILFNDIKSAKVKISFE